MHCSHFAGPLYGKLLVQYIDIQQKNVTLHKLQTYCWSKIWLGDGPLYSHSFNKMCSDLNCSHLVGAKYGKLLFHYIAIQTEKYHSTCTAVILLVQTRVRCWSLIQLFNQQYVTIHKLQSFCWSKILQGVGPLYSHSTSKILPQINCSHFAGPKYGKVLVLFIVIQPINIFLT